MFVEKDSLIKMCLRVMEIFKEAIFPSNIYCICCGEAIAPSMIYSLCGGCLKNLRWANHANCDKCGKPLQEGYWRNLCTDCRETDFLFDRGYSCVEYGMYEKMMLKDYKYHSRPYLGDKLAWIMADRLEPEEIRADWILPVPMERSKERKRGYNQAALMARGLSRRMGIPWEKDLLLRHRKTRVMNNLSPSDRRENVQGAFSLKSGRADLVRGRKILLVDDIYTTGSTLNECSRILLDAGAEEVRFICFASGSNRLHWEEDRVEEVN